MTAPPGDERATPTAPPTVGDAVRSSPPWPMPTTSRAAALDITPSHYTALRLIRDRQNVGELSPLLGGLYLHALIVDDAVGIALTDAGLRLLERAPTVRLPRVRLESRPAPEGWGVRQYEFGIVYDRKGTPRITWDHSACVAASFGDYGPIEDVLADARAIVAALEHVQHERAVMMQDGEP